MPYIVFEKYLMWLFYSSNNLGWFACFRIQFLPDHIMIHSCRVCVCVCVFLAARPFCNSGSMPTSTAWCSGSTLESSWPSCCLYSRRSDFRKNKWLDWFRLWHSALLQASRKKSQNVGWIHSHGCMWSFWHRQHGKNGSFDLCGLRICLWQSVAPQLDAVSAH